MELHNLTQSVKLFLRQPIAAHLARADARHCAPWVRCGFKEPRERETVRKSRRIHKLASGAGHQSLHGDFATAFRQAAPGSSSSANFRMAEDYRPMFLGGRPLDKALRVR
jgi:hypothetical protein